MLTNKFQNNNLNNKVNGIFSIFEALTNADESWHYNIMPNGFNKSNAFIVSVMNPNSSSQIFNKSEQFEYFIEDVYFVCRGLNTENQSAALKILVYKE